MNAMRRARNGGKTRSKMAKGVIDQNSSVHRLKTTVAGLPMNLPLAGQAAGRRSKQSSRQAKPVLCRLPLLNSWKPG